MPSSRVGRYRFACRDPRAHRLQHEQRQATTTKFMIAVTTNTMCQLPVEALIRLATGTRKADAPLAV